MRHRLFVAILIAAGSLALFELGLRIVSGFALPYVPSVSDEMGLTYLPPSTSFRVRFAGRPTVTYHTDAHSARIADSDAASSVSVMAMGDSQILGYGLPFEETAAARVAVGLKPPGSATLLAAPAVDIESMALRGCGPVDEGSVPTVQLIGLNLGNDLDEMYVAGQSRRAIATSPMRAWLGVHSYLYAYWMLTQYKAALERHTLPGINPMLFRLTPPERVVLAREAAALVAGIAACSHARRTLVLVFPSDFQLDPDEILKYRKYSANTEEFDKWSSRRVALAQSMNALEDYVIKNLESKGYEAISIRRELMQRGARAVEVFDRESHHLTAAGQRITAEAILERVR